MLDYFIVALLLVMFVLIVMYSRIEMRYRKIQEDYCKLASSKQSLATKHGQMTEQFMPFASVYPYDKNNFRFLGSPIDGVQFNDDSVVFVEFKTNKSQLSDRQKKIKRLVDEKKIRFEEFRI